MEESSVVEERVCVCGCGERFVPRRSWQKFKDARHQREYWGKLYKEAYDKVKAVNA